MSLDLNEQQQAYLQQSAGASLEGVRRLAWSALLSELHAGDMATAGARMHELLDECDSRMDCTDFRLNLLLRALPLFGDRIADAIRQRIKSVALAARYYGGFSRDYPMFYNSENHHLNWAVAEYLTAQFWPDETFGFDGRSAQQHRLRARFLIGRWIDGRARWGFREFNSSCYMGVNLLSLLNLIDLAREPDIRRIATGSMTQMMADLAADSIGGGVWSAQARIYERQLFCRGDQGIAGVFSMLMGIGDVSEIHASNVGDFIATTGYRPPDWLVRLARDPQTPMVNQERHREEKGLRYSCHSTFWKPPIELVDDAYSRIWYPEDVFAFNVRTERCAQYMVSAAITEAGFPLHHTFAQAMVWLSCLKGRAQVFTTHPAAGTDHKNRSVYWAGTNVMPRCYLQDGVLAAVYHSTAESHPDAAEFTHAYFPTDMLDRWSRVGPWYFGQLEDAYIGLFAPPGAALAEHGPWAGRDLQAPGRTAVWLAVYGSAAADGAFEDFMRRCDGIGLEFDPATATAKVQAGTVGFEISYERGVFVAGEPFSADAWKQIDNPVIQSDFGDPVFHIRGQGEAQTLDLSEAHRIAQEAYAKL